MSSFRTSNQLSDLLMALLTAEEWKVLYYIIRRTHGLKMADGNRISLREFVSGHSDNGTQKDYGTGLSVQAIERALAGLKKYNVVVEIEPPNHPMAIAALYRVETDSSQIDIDGLERRTAERIERDRARTEKARAVKLAAKSTPSVGHNAASTPSVGQKQPPQSDTIDPLSGTETTPSVGHNAYKERQGYRHGLSQEKKPEEENASVTPTRAATATKPRRVSKYENEILEVFGYWQSELKHPNSQLGKVRRKAVRERLTEGYTVALLKMAIDGCRASPNFKGKRYDDLAMICANEQNVDYFISIAKGDIEPDASMKGQSKLSDSQLLARHENFVEVLQNG